MKVRDIMSENPACCTAESSLQDVAKMMLENDCGAIPVVEDKGNKNPIGIITDRDITCRAVAAGKSPGQTRVKDCMSTPVATVSAEADLEECCMLMEDQLVRRVLVVDGDGACCGIVAQADIARSDSDDWTAEIVREISQPNEIGADY